MKSFYIILISGLFICLFAGISIYFILSPRQSNSNAKPVNEYYYNENTETGVNSLKTTTVNNLSGSAKIHADILNPQRVAETNQESIAVLINRDYSLPSDYIPSDLVIPDITFNISYYNEKKLMRQEAAVALEKLFSAAEKENIQLNAVSGYRSYARQEEIYNENLRTKGDAHTNQYSAKPGYSEHQSGLSMDVSAPSINNQLDESLADTTEGKWLADNCYLFGFTIRYPKGKENITFYSYEPWHLRYVGLELAEYLFKNEFTLEEFYNYKPSDEVKKSFISTKEKAVDIDPIAEKATDPTQAPETQSNYPISNQRNQKEETPEPSPEKIQKTVEPSPTPTQQATPKPIQETPVETIAPTIEPSITEDIPPKETVSPEVIPTKVPPTKPEKTPAPTPKEEAKPVPKKEPSNIELAPEEMGEELLESQSSPEIVPSADPVS